MLVGAKGSVTTSAGRPVLNWAEGKIFVSTTAHIIGGKSKEFSLRFLYYFLQSIDISESIYGQIPEFTVKKLSEIQVPVLPLCIQEKIVSVLDVLSELITVNSSDCTKEIELRLKQQMYYRNLILKL